MFIFEQLQNNKNKQDIVVESFGKFNRLISESGINDIFSNYDNIIKTSLIETNYVYNEHVQQNLKEYSLNILNNALKILDDSIFILNAYKNIILAEIDYAKRINKKVIETYEPLLKRLDRHKYGYQISEYTLDNLCPEDSLKRVLDYLSKKLNLDCICKNKVLSEDELQNAINKYNKYSNEYVEDIKRIVLGVPKSYNISDFHATVREFLVKDNNLQMKRIGDDLFKYLREIFIDVEGIDSVIEILRKEIVEIYSLKNRIEEDQSYFYINTIFANAVAIRINLIVKALEYIEEILKIKVTIFEELCINYRKVIINGYETISSDPESSEGIYNPSKDEKILEKHSEFLSGHWIYTNE